MRDSLKWIVMIFFVISFVFGIVGCKEPEIQVDTSVNYGSIKGKVLYSNENINNHSGIQITLVSTDGLMTTEYSSSRGIATKARSVKDIKTTDKYGMYSFENIPVGVYTLYASSNSSLEKAVATNIVVKGKQTVIANDLNLTATGSVRGYVSIIGSADNTESPLGLDVFIAGTSFDGKVGLDGCFELTGIPAKTGYVLCVQKGDYVKIVDDNLEIISNYTVDVSHIYLSENDLKEGMMQWLGVYDSWPENPRLYDAFFNLTDGCSYIWNGNNWDLLAQGGKDGKDGKDGNSINWLGGYYDNNDISDPQYLDAYYSYTDGCSYIWNGYSWDLLSKDGQGINWLGSYYDASEIVNPQYLDAYYNYTDGCSYIWNWGSWDLLAKDGSNGQGINWLGWFDSYIGIENPQYLDAYYNYTDGCSYIWNGYSWEMFARDGIDGENGETGQGIDWLGSYPNADEIYDPQYLDAYYNYTDGCSYIWNGYSWDLLAKDGINGQGINWLGSYVSPYEIYDPQKLDAYFNTIDGCSYIYTDNGWELLAQRGQGINWLGSYVSPYEIYAPQYLDAYFNTTDGCSYIYTDNDWKLLAQNVRINWLGSYSGTDEFYDPQYLDAYYDTSDGCSYIYTANGWTLFAKAGADGKNIVWRGNFEDANLIENPQELDAYFNTTDGCSYIYTNNDWKLLAQAGANGKSIVWIGSYPNADDIGEPQLLWAYYNITDGCSYIYDGSTWQLLARKGTDGATGSGDGSIRWRGTFANVNEVYEPAPLDAFFNTTDGCSYIYNGTNWVMLAKAGEDGKDGTDGTNGTNGKDGEDGEDGKGINWRGSYSTVSDISSPKYLDAYWNTTENCAYVYNGSEWTVLIKGPASGGTGSSSNTNIGSELGANVVGTTLISWDSTPATGVVRIPNGVTDIAEEVFYDNDTITRVIIPSTVVNIGYRAFCGCDNITSVEFLGNGLEIISESAFDGCGNLVNFTLPSSLEIIGKNAFYGCKKITTVNIPDNVIIVGSKAFEGCWMLRTLTIGSGVTELLYRTFSNCDSLVSVTIPDTVISINNTVFVECDSISELQITGTWDSGNNLTIENLCIDKNSAYSHTYTRDTY